MRIRGEIRNQLVLNLCLLETEDWYYFDRYPKRDSKLNQFMNDCPECGFICVEMASLPGILFFPLSYFSTVGFHEFGNLVGFRPQGRDDIEQLELPAAIDLFLRALFGLAIQIENFNGFVSAYKQSIASEFKWSKADSELSNTSDSQNGIPLVYLAASDFFSPWNNESCLELLQLVDLHSNYLGMDRRSYIAVWFEKYCSLLIHRVFKTYMDGDGAVACSYLNTKVALDKQGFPVKMRWINSQFGQSNIGPLSSGRRRRLNQRLLSQFYTHHLFALIRTIGYLRIEREGVLVEQLASIVQEQVSKYSQSLNFVFDTKVAVCCFLSQWLEAGEPCVRKYKRKHNPMINPQFYAEELIKPQPGELVCKRYFDDGKYEIALRGFDLESDLELVHQWVNLDYAKKFWEMDGPIEELERAYIKHLGVDYSQPYIGLLNGEPIFTLELYWAVKDEVGKYYPFQAGDYGFHMLIAPAKSYIPNFSYHALCLCMEHFFSYPQVHRIIGEASVDHQGTHNLITKVGCEFDRALVLPYKTSNLTFLNRGQFDKSARAVLENSTQSICVNI